jgi:cytochrome c-type biogenesis protein CcmH
MTLWVSLAAMCLVATLFLIWPLYRQQQRLSLLIAGCVATIVIISLGLYAYQGRPGLPSGAGTGEQPDIEAMVTSLAARLENEPDDLNGWKMLGRSYMTMQNFAGAVQAYERALEIEESQNPQTMVDLGAALLARDKTGIEGRTAALFESALALDPNNPNALFYGGIAALNRGDTELAAERWEILLGLNPPDEIRGVLEQRVAEWRGEPLPVQEAPQAAKAGPVISARISVPPAIQESLSAEASVFIIARDPAQPSPPIAVTRRQLSELPAVVALGDSESMIPGRNLSGFVEFEVVVRVSVSGQPIAQSGDWFASAIVKPAESNEVSLVVEQQVP